METPTRWDIALFEAKAVLLRGRRGARDAMHGVRRLPRSRDEGRVLLAEARSPLWIEREKIERPLEQGKVQNLRVAARALDRTRVDPGAIFSFWKQVGPPMRARGFAVGRMIKEGCIVPSIGGGMCQLSNALYDVAVRGGLEIVERHRHSRRISTGEPFDPSRPDATVAYNYVDLRFRSDRPVLLRVELTARELVVRLLSLEPRAKRTRSNGRVAIVSRDEPSPPEASGGSCTTCDAHECARKRDVPAPRSGRAAFLVDVRWPEHEAWVLAQRTARDQLVLPIDGVRANVARFAWETSGFSRVDATPAPAMFRALQARRFARQGARRILADLEATELVADAMAKMLAPDVEHLCVAQSLLPFLWDRGVLGGRTFDVLATRLPLRALHDRLDAAARAFPERATLREYRAPAWIVAAEETALGRASRVVTPHAEVARAVGAKPCAWHLPAPAFTRPGDALLFAGPTAARKGAHDLRDAALATGARLALAGAELEGDDFWRGVSVTPRAHRHPDGIFDGVRAVIQPALVEDSPRLLLRALACGIPVLATAACGLPAGSYVEIPYGDPVALARAIDRLAVKSRPVAQLSAEIAP